MIVIPPPAIYFLVSASLDGTEFISTFQRFMDVSDWNLLQFAPNRKFSYDQYLSSDWFVGGKKCIKGFI